MTEPIQSTSSRVWPHVAFVLVGLASVGLFWRPLRQLEALSLSADPYSYILLIPLISAFFFYLEQRKIFASLSASHALIIAGALAIFGLLAGFLAMDILSLPTEYALTIKMLSILLVWAAAFALCYGVPALRAAKFPFLLLLLLVPIPVHWMDRIVTTLQWGSAGATYSLFQLIGVPIFRNGVNFQLPIVSIEIAKECSSIHSACALFVTGLLVGHLFLRSLGAKVWLTLLTVPIAMFTNAVRIVTLWSLATKVDIGFLYGNLHHRGGILFALLALCILMGCVYLLQKLEGRGRPTAASRRMDRGNTSNEDWASRSDPSAEITKP